MASQLPPGTLWEPSQVPSLSTPEIINGDLPRSYYVQGADGAQISLGYGGHANWCCVLDGALTTTPVDLLLYWPAFATHARPGVLASGNGTVVLTVGLSTYTITVGGSETDGTGVAYSNATVWWGDSDYKLSKSQTDRPLITQPAQVSLDSSASNLRAYALVLEFARHQLSL